MKPIVLLKLTGTGLIAVLVVFVATHPAFLAIAGTDYFLFTTLLGVVVIHLRLSPKLLDLAVLIAGIAALGLLAPRMVSFPVSQFAYLSMPGMVSLAVLPGRIIWGQGDRKLIAAALGTAACFVSAGWLTGPMLRYVTHLRPLVLDLYLYSLDGSFRAQFSFLMGQAFVKWRWFATISIWCYIGLPLILALAFVENLVRDVWRGIKVASVFLFCGPIGAMFYTLFPGLGPRMLFAKDFPFHPLTALAASQVQLQPISLEGPRNAIPSLHMTWVLLAWWCCERTSVPTRIVAAFFVIFTITSTMGTGEHYFVDLVVAAPFTLFLYAMFCADLSWRDHKRWTATLGGLAMVLIWFALLRYAPHLFWISPVIPWTMVVATVVATVWLKRRLAAISVEATAKNKAAPLVDIPAGDPEGVTAR